MSRVGRKSIAVPKGVEVKVTPTSVVVKGPKGTLEERLPRQGISVSVENGEVLVKRANDERDVRSLHGMMRNLIANMVKGVTEGFRKDLEMIGVGYRSELKGKDLQLALGFSHPILFPIPEGIQIKVNNQTKLEVTGANKQLVGQTAAEIRELRPPEPYQGKGVRYLGEVVRRKAGKSAATGGASGGA